MTHKPLALLLAMPVATLALDGINFEHGDWQVTCDNTGTCRAAGYQSDDYDGEGMPPAVSVLFTRKAGENEAVQGKIAFLDASGESAPAQVEMQIDGKTLGKLALKDGDAPLDKAQIDALLAAVQKKDSIITFRENADKPLWQLSIDGANAVLLKMDDFQKRVGTPSALTKRGDTKTRVLAPVAAPRIKAVTPPQEAPRALKKGDTDFETMKKLLATHYLSEEAYLDLTEKEDHHDRCPLGDYSIQSEDALITLYPLDEAHYLSESPCWLALYNTGNLYTLVSRDLKKIEKTYDNRLNDYDPKTGTLSGNQKARGLGDCWSSVSYQWDGKDFVQSYLTSGGMCKGFAGGAWQMPLFVSEVETAQGIVRVDEAIDKATSNNQAATQ
ncbi:DUF1176 domain-containing protein [Cardiobacterium hominis]|uniref:DUF1176 domain-containing protein n=1 Tax=Cardiobacterium hominis TaxID=2718 RepID=UPI0028E891BF|nr:DUF1176 domain-containing protein [Cardiobacterium hominis]